MLRITTLGISMFFLLECCAVGVLILGALFLPGFPSGWFKAAENQLSRLARRRVLAVIAVGVLALAIRAALLPIAPVPQAGFHDEFGYLLLGDTFAHGRVTNPTHPMWIHFESFYIIQQPTYTAMFYPGQGLVLALGQVIGGHPFVGVWLSIGAMCAAICWMLQAWVPPAWALLGGVLAIIRLGSFSYWANSYQVGALPALGGALVLGSLPRIKRRRRVRDALVMGAGVAILVNTRPYESLFFCLPVSVAIFAWLQRAKGSQLRESLLHVLLPLGLLLAATAGSMAYYFWRTTGSPFRTPYMVDAQTYRVVPYFPWQPLNLEHTYHHRVFEQFFLHEWQMDSYRQARLSPFAASAGKISDFYRFFLGPALALPLLVVFVLNPSKFLQRAVTGKTGCLVEVCGATFIGLSLPIYFNPHYAAPLTSAIYALVLQSMRYLRLWRWRGKGVGLRLVRAIPLTCVLLFMLRAAAPRLHIPTPVEWKYTWESEHFQNLDRARALAKLRSLEGDHLVIVRYNQHHAAANEWVYNRADIDSAKVVWAHDMGERENAELIRYFPRRHVWFAEPDLAPPRISPYVVPLDPCAPASSRGKP